MHTDASDIAYYKTIRKCFSPEVADIIDSYVKLAEDKDDMIYFRINDGESSECGLEFRVSEYPRSPLYYAYEHIPESHAFIDRPVGIWFFFVTLGRNEGGSLFTKNVSLWTSGASRKIKFGAGCHYGKENFDASIISCLNEGLNSLLTIKAMVYAHIHHH